MSPLLAALVERGHKVKRQKGQTIINEGEQGDTLFVVLEGRLRAYSMGMDGREITYGEYGAGEFVGELSLDGGRRSASVEASAPTVLAVVHREALLQHIREHPEFTFELLRKLIWRVRHVTHGLRSVALHSVQDRLLDLLEQLAQSQADGSRLIDPAPSHKEFAARLGCSREMVSRVLKDLENEGCVEVGRRRVVLLRALPRGI